MKRINNIVVSNTEPSVNSLWITQNTIKWFGKSGWEGLDFTDNTKLWNAINQEISDRQEEDDYIKKNALKSSRIDMTGFSRDNEYWIQYSYTYEAIDGPLLSVDKTLSISTASSTENGMMSFSDKAKLDSIDVTTLVNTVDGLIPAAYLPSYVDDVLEYSSVNTFPETGEAGKIYVDTTTNLTYRWTGTQYIEVSKSLGLGETASAAYPGDKGKQNADNIAALQGDITDINGTISNLGNTYATKEEMNQADTNLQNSIDKLSNSIDEKFNEELSGYLPLTGGMMTLTPDDIRESNHISFNIKNFDVPFIELTGKGITEAACLRAEAGRVEVCGYLPEGPGYRHWAQLDRDGVHLYNEYYTPGSASFTRSGVTIDGKTTSDLLNAAGGTTSVSDITTQVKAAIVDSAPETLDTLNELAAALGDDPNFATTVTNQIASKQDKLVSGTNIKTINGQTLLGSGDVDMSEFASRTELEGYLPLSGGGTIVNAYGSNKDNLIINENSIAINEENRYADTYIRSGFFRILGTPKSNGIMLGMSDGTTPYVWLTDRTTTVPGKAGLTIYKEGVNIYGKTSSDLLHAAGGTISIDNLKTQIISDLSAQVSTLQTQITELTSRIEALEND
jgi:hypothetical protein